MEAFGPLRTLWVKISVAAATVILGTGAVAAGAIDRRRAARITHAWGRLCLRLAGIPVRTEGLHHLRTGRRYVIMANHESGLDIPALLAALPPSLESCFLAKRSLFTIPFLGWAMRAAGFVAVDRDDRSTAASTFSEALRVIERRGSPLVFPEETWTQDGALLPFQRGGFLIALKAGLEILPIGLEGPRLVMPPGSPRLFQHPVTVRIGRPIPTTGLRTSDRVELTSEVRQAVDVLRGNRGHLRDNQDVGEV